VILSSNSGSAPALPPVANPAAQAALTGPTPTRAAARAVLAANAAKANQILDTTIQAELARLPGVPVVINQWASWCTNCKFEFPFFQQAARADANRVAFVGLDSQDSQSKAQAFLAQFPVNYPSVFDRSASIASTVITGLNRQWHVDALMQRAGRGGPLVTGAAFALAWTPCVGPTLGAILSAAALSSSALHGAVLLAFYSAGLAIPFLATAIAFERMTSLFAVIKRHFRVVIASGGIVLIAMGVLVWSGELFQLNIQAQQALDGIGLNFFNSI
jgi:thiol:disulfide interchange protein